MPPTTSTTMRRTGARATNDTPLGSHVAPTCATDFDAGELANSTGPAQLCPPEARCYVVLHHADGLHERVADRRSDEPEPSLLQVLAHGPGLRSLGWDVRQTPPRVRGVRSGQGRPVPDDAWIPHQSLDLPPVEPGDLGRIEPRERVPVPLPLVQDGLPRQPRLCALERQHLEQMAFVPAGCSPFLVVVGEHESIASLSPLAPIPRHGAPFTRAAMVRSRPARRTPARTARHSKARRLRRSTGRGSSRTREPCTASVPRRTVRPGSRPRPVRDARSAGAPQPAGRSPAGGTRRRTPW